MAHFTCEVVYRGIFQKNLAARISRGIVLSARKAGRWGIAFGRYGDSPQRNGIPAKDFAIVADTQEELEQNMARYEPKEVDVTICVDDTLSKGVESWAWYGLQPINRLTVPNGHAAHDLAADARASSSRTSTRRTRPTTWPSSRPRPPSRASGSTRRITRRRACSGRSPRSSPEFLVARRGVRRPSGRPSGARSSRRQSARKAHERLTTRPGQDHRGQLARRRSPSRSRSGGRCARA